MKKIVIRKDMVKKAILKAVDNAIDEVDFKVGVKRVYDIRRDTPTGEKIIAAVEAYAKTKGVGVKTREWGDGTAEVEIDPE